MNPQDVAEFKQLLRELLAAVDKQSALIEKTLKKISAQPKSV